MTIASVRWAVRSKRPGQHEGYRILADDSGGSRREEYAQRLGQLVTGNPSTAPAGAPNALPWVAISPLGYAATAERLAVATLEWPAEQIRDASGRLTALSRYFDVGFADLAAAGTTYSGLYTALDALGVPQTADLSIALTGVDLAEIAGHIDQLGFSEIVLAAAALLEGPVVLTGESIPTSVGMRIRYLDAVAALLPFGLRADLAVGTWSPNRGAQPLRLFFSDYVAPGQRGVQIGRSGALTFTGQVAVDYADRLSRLRSAMGTAGLIAELWRERQPCRFDTPSGVLDSLGRLDRPYAIWQDLRRGIAGVDQVRALLTETDLPRTEPDVWRDLVRCLIDQGSDADLLLLARHWSPAISAELAGAVARSGSPERAMACVQVAIQAKEFDTFGVDLLLAARAGSTQRLRIAHVLAQWRVGDAPLMRAALMQDPDFACRLLLVCLNPSTNAVDSWLDLLLGAPQDERAAWLEPFLILLSGGGAIPERAAISAKTSGDRTLLALLAVSMHVRCPQLFLSSKWTWGHLFLAIRDGDERMRREFYAVAEKAVDLDGYDRALLDLLIITSGHQPIWPQDGVPAQADPYRAALADKLPKLGAAWETKCIDVIVRSMVGTAITTRQADFLIGMAELLPPGRAQLHALTRIANAAAESPGVLIGQKRTIITQLQNLSPILQARSIVFDLAPAARANTSATELGHMCASAILNGVPMAQVLSHVEAWSGWEDPVQSFRLLRTIAGDCDHHSVDEGAEVYQLGVSHVLSGGFGPQSANAFRQYLTTRQELEKRRAPIEARGLKKIKPPGAESSSWVRWPRRRDKTADLNGGTTT
jgi:hypothetical protein